MYQLSFVSMCITIIKILIFLSQLNKADQMECFYYAGFTDGSVVLTKGDITRDRHSKTLTLHEGTSPVTGLAFRQVAKVTHLFVATLEKVHVGFCFTQENTYQRETRLAHCLG